MNRILEILGVAALTVLLMGGASMIQGRGNSAFVPGGDFMQEPIQTPLLGPEAMRDSCVPPSPFELPNRGPAIC